VPTNGVVLNLCDLQKYVKSKTRVLYHVSLVDDPVMRLGVTALFVFLVLAPWWPSQESDWTEIWPVSYSTYVQSLRSMAPGVSKRAMLKDDDPVR
jgi:hypothetical protein